MRQMILMVLLIGITVTVQAQDVQGFFKQLTTNYSEQDGFSASMLSSDMFDLYMKKKDLDKDSEVAAALKNLDNILVVSQSKFGNAYMAFNEQANTGAKKSETDLGKVYKDILAHYNTGDYTLLKTEKRMGEDVKVYLKKKNGEISSLALVTNSNTVTSLVELDGKIDLANVASLSKAMNLRGLENLYKIDNKSPYGAYEPYIDEARIEEMAARAREMAERQSQLSEEQIRKIEEQAEMQAQKQMEMAEKYREMAEKYGRQPIFLNYPGDSVIYYLNGKKVSADEIKELNKEDIEKVEVNKPGKDGKKSEIHITTK
ncbi:DUF4252 domain-containing protein [Maribellus sediminis]|uniref:DUF4252 domain-containing protein n=1 Tax=Maribellus sediminis TaxID=2696285 RepID=UPI00143188D6|nr:DUF4252 domain-containing protein [Maribellus sediminis]